MSTPARSLTARTPLRVTLVAAVVLLSALGLLLSGLAARTALHGYLLDRVDGQLVAAVNDPGQLNQLVDGDGRPGRRAPDSFGALYVQFGNRVGALPTGFSPPALPEVLPSDRVPFTVASQTGSRQWRVVAGPAVNRLTQAQGLLVLAVPLDDVQSTVRRLTRIEATVGTLVLMLLGGAAFLLVRRALRPLVQVERVAEEVAAGDLSLRVPESDPRTEVGSLSRSFNAMVSQIETAFAERSASEAEARASEERMRRFVGDASHELRTPLTSIRGFAELYRQGALPSAEDVARAMSRVESEAARMGLLVQDLLLLARLDQQRPLERQPVDLLELCRDAVHDARAVDPERSISLEAVAAGPAPVVTGDAPRLRQVLGNLVTNALMHTTAGTPVAVRVSTTGSEAVVEVIDQGAGIPDADRQRVFERFYRADSSRTRASGGSGLGLSIVAALVAAHGGTVTALETPGGGTTMRVSVPLSVVPQPSGSTSR